MKYSYDEEGILMLQANSENNKSKNVDHFILIDEYNMADKKSEISTFLTNSPIRLGGRTDKIELSPPHWFHMREFLIDSLEVDYGYGNDWYLYTLDKDLFLRIGETLIHVTDFDNQKLTGLTYVRDISGIEIIQSSYTQMFDTTYLLGTWIKTESSLAENEKNNIIKIQINNNKLIISNETFSDTLQWQLNTYKNKILLKDDHNNYFGKYWKIESLSKENLVLKRKRNRMYNYEIEVFTFKKEL